VPVIPALGRQRQEDHEQRTGWATQHDPVSKKKKKRKRPGVVLTSIISAMGRQRLGGLWFETIPSKNLARPHFSQ
jgi:hypothetical protein